MAAKKRTKERRKHSFYADANIPADPYSGLQRCRRCLVMGKPGDQRHTDEFPETPPEDVTNRILGENE